MNCFKCVVPFVFLLTALTASAGTVGDKISCYSCFYDITIDKVTKGESKCLEGPFDDINIVDGFQKCYKAMVLKGGEVLSMHRGGGSAALSAFAELVSRQEDDFEIKYCHEDLCNAASSSMYSTGLMASLVVLVLSCVNKLY